MNQVFNNEEPERVEVQAEIMPAGAGLSALVRAYKEHPKDPSESKPDQSESI